MPTSLAALTQDRISGTSRGGGAGFAEQLTGNIDKGKARRSSGSVS
jgi:hypothetical protein